MSETIDKIKETDDMLLLIEQHKRDNWEWQQKESQWIRDKNQLEGNKRIIEDLSTKMVALKKRVEEAEGETTIVKGIGMNSPEMRAAQAKLKEAEEINKLHQELNGKLQTQLTEVTEDNKKLAIQIQDLIKSKQPF
jgi:hypothetical protein